MSAALCPQEAVCCINLCGVGGQTSGLRGQGRTGLSANSWLRSVGSGGPKSKQSSCDKVILTPLRLLTTEYQQTQ